LDLMASGLSAQDTLTRLLRDDGLRERRQVACVDAQGRAAAHTGKDCYEWAGHRIGQGYSCQGNILTGPETVDAMADAFSGLRRPGDPLRQRCGQATQQADRRGKQSAAALVVCRAAAMAAM
jgi:uncharacterized Ntn-hydrolase superfamily protein